MKASFGEKVLSGQGREVCVGEGGGRGMERPSRQRALWTEPCGAQAHAVSDG